MKEKYSKPEGDKELSEAEVRECVCMRASVSTISSISAVSHCL